jgi:hypothetical protein
MRHIETRQERRKDSFRFNSHRALKSFFSLPQSFFEAKAHEESQKNRKKKARFLIPRFRILQQNTVEMPPATLSPDDKAIVRAALGNAQVRHVWTLLTPPRFTARRWPRLSLRSRIRNHGLNTIWRALSPSSPTPKRTTPISYVSSTSRCSLGFRQAVADCAQKRTVVWEQEVDSTMAYSQERPFFHSFPADVRPFSDGCANGQRWTVGALFVDENDALAMYTKIQNRHTLRSTNDAVKSVSGGVGAKRDVKKKKKFDKMQIGAPSNFRHLTHIGWDPEKGFSVRLMMMMAILILQTRNIPPEWKKVFDDAGVTDEQLKDKQTAKFIYSFMTENANV